MKPVQIPCFISIGTTSIELREFKEKEKKKNMDKNRCLVIKRKWYYSEIFHTQFCFDMFYALKSSEVEMT